jgi:hypothetical protein
MPRSVIEADELGEAAIARNDQMRRHPKIADFGKVRVRIARQRVGEKPFYPGAAELTGGQTDAVHDDQIRLDARWTCVKIWRSDLPGTSYQSAFEIDLQELSLSYRRVFGARGLR